MIKIKIELIINAGGKTIDASNAVENISLSHSMYDTPGKCEFSLIDVIEIPNGSPVALKIDEKEIFYGFVFSKNVNEKNNLDLIAYDQLRYLKNQDTVYYEDKTANQILEDICKKNNLKYKIINPANWKILPYLYEKKTMFDIIKHALDETFRMENKKYIIRDNFGTLEFIDIEKQKTNLQIGTGSLLNSYSYGKSIDEDTFNVVKLIRDNKETQKRDVWISQDTAAIKKWGKLQYLYDVDEHANEEQIKELADNIIKVKSRETRTLSLSIVGFYNLRVGDGVKIEIDNVLSEWFYLTGVSSNIKNDFATTDLEVFIV